jgi:gliding motility-associated-like protein
MFYYKKEHLNRLLIFCVLALSCFVGKAQLNVDFTTDKEGGCSPLTISFTNTTTGASASATYSWDLGNGNTSTLKNPGATYRDEQTYTIILTVKDGAQTVSKSKQITVYKKPVVDFQPSATKGCVPLAVTFTSNSTAGDGTIKDYFWDYGDGSTQKTTAAITSHTYTAAQKSAVALTVTNIYGCFNTLQKPDLIDASPGITVSFTADKTVVCKTSDAVKFTNTSTGPSNITYAWDFGDGNTSTDKEPSYTYNQKGTFTVKLTVSSAAGCSQTITKTNYINVANFTSNFDVPALICQNISATFTNRSTPTPSGSTWQFNSSFFGYGTNSANYQFNIAGPYTIKLTNTFGTCQDVVTKDIVVKESPKLNGFIANMGGVCGAPVTVQFSDTSAAAVSWLWNFNWPYSSNTATTKNATYTYTSQGNYTAALTITDASGCSTTKTHTINATKPIVYINIVTSNGINPGSSSGCEGLTATFAANPANDITDYKWEFGDGGTSTAAQPQHTFTGSGTYSVKLSYTTVSGCKDVVYYNSVYVYKKPDVDFTSQQGTTICGNTPVTFTATSPTNNLGSNWLWLVNNQYVSSTSYNSQFVYQFTTDTTYTITLIASNSGCRDTVVKKDYIKVLPPFPKIQTVTNTCAGTRGQVTFKEASKKALQYSWDFGDGSAPVTYSTSQPSINHTYNNTGTYKVVLTTVNGQCSLRDSTTAYVLLKQAPQLSSTQTEVCGSDKLNIVLKNYEVNPYPTYYSYYSQYGITRIEYGDNTAFTGTTSSSSSYWTTPYQVTLQNLDNGKRDLRVITNSAYFNCLDTTNFITLKIKGPVAKLNIISNNVCYKTPIVFTDSSKGTNNIPIKKWEWNYGNGRTDTYTAVRNPISYVYQDPGQFNVTLKVTDDEGCSATTPSYTNYATVNGPKAMFSYSPASITPGSTVTFNNNTNNYNSYNTQYKWLFKDGTTSTNYTTTKFYPVTGTDTVRLIAVNPTNGCRDTAIQPIIIKNVNAAFTYTTSYVNNNSCPPVIVRFTNTSVNVVSVSWNFGDGSKADNQNFPSHTYYKPGVYNVTLYAKAPNGTIDSVVQSITVKGPYAILKADVLSGCGSQTVTLTAEVKNATSFTWDFGDGAIQQSSDTFSVHTYVTPGVYIPALILKDAGGCSATSEMTDKVIIDTLNVKMQRTPLHVCDSALVAFDATIKSLAVDKLQQTLSYQWNFGTGAAGDTADTKAASFLFSTPGRYPVSLKVTSPYGCYKEVIDTVEVFARAKGSIAGPAEICESSSATFTGSSNLNSTAITYAWNFNNGNSSPGQNPAAQLYNNAGTYQVQLVVNNNGCYDTSMHSLVVRAQPIINVSPKTATVCLGKSIQLTAGGGNTFSWSNTAGLSDYTVSHPIATPATNTKYIVEVTNAYGCKNKDTASIFVQGPITVKLPADTAVCNGNSVQLTATGAATYTWINNTIGLSNTTISNPIATPASATTYTVVGTDAFQCFTSTASVNVNVVPSPSVNAGADLTVQTGSVIKLKAQSSSDATKWSWTPADYLSCANCQSPSSAPRSDISYVVKAENQYGCTAYDTVNVKLVCAQSNVFIPTAFTPNKDLTNDVFYIKGSGVKMIKFLKIFNRSGYVVFEKTNFNIDDRSAGWDGKNNGYEVPPGAYVYITDMVCDTGEIFSYKGTVVVIR